MIPIVFSLTIIFAITIYVLITVSKERKPEHMISVTVEHNVMKNLFNFCKEHFTYREMRNFRVDQSIRSQSITFTDTYLGQSITLSFFSGNFYQARKAFFSLMLKSLKSRNVTVLRQNGLLFKITPLPNGLVTLTIENEYV